MSIIFLSVSCVGLAVASLCNTFALGNLRKRIEILERLEIQRMEQDKHKILEELTQRKTI